ncbi:MAG: tRNA (adenosine(37)-N6)-dimethylallyltransferase MiaA, partial [Oscillospiraceae bacterium]|nr:tRNA (adenosine(37)-N6)-dimethylallyltransferase MiaA [Oscillospiraceae bacterium]
MKKKPLIVIAGPTASGKTSLGVEVCKEFSGEVISADSMQIYKGMDIATAKPTKEEMQGIPHHMTDFLPVDESFSVADFQRLAAEFADEIYSRNHLPVIVGGTGLYIDSFVNNTKLTETPTDRVLRQKLFDRAQNEGAGALLEELRAIDPEYAENLHENNIKRVVRALELWYSGGKTM